MMIGRSFSVKDRIGALAVAGVLAVSTGAMAQATGAAAQTTGAADTTASGQKAAATTAVTTPAKAKQPKTRKEDKVIVSKDTKKELRKGKKDNPLEGQDANLPDKQLYDKAMAAIKVGHFDTARLDLQTLLNTYSDSEYQARAKLAIADSWFKEGGSAALDQAESEYKDFITFFPNSPEAAEAQMRVGDIYFREMDRTDRDYVKAVRAKEEYVLMLTQFPDSPLIPQARQKLRDVQEALADREAGIGAQYVMHEAWPAAEARFQTVVDTYPLYSQMDEVLIALGDSYEAEARFVRNRKDLPEGAKAELESEADGKAADAYKRVVLEHSATAHVEDAKDRLAAMDIPIPTPTAAQMAASVALESSRSQYTISSRAQLIFMHKPDVVLAAKIGDPPLVDPPPTLAPDLVKKEIENFKVALNPGAARSATATAPQPAPEAAATAPAAPVATAPAAPAGPLMFSDVPTAAEGTGGSSAVMTTGNAGSSTHTAVGSLEIISPSTSTSTSTPAAAAPATPAATADVNSALKTVGPSDAKPLPAVEKAAALPVEGDNRVPASGQPTPAPTANGKKPKAAPVDTKDESSSTKKKKKGLAKLNPF